MPFRIAILASCYGNELAYFTTNNKYFHITYQSIELFFVNNGCGQRGCSAKYTRAICVINIGVIGTRRWTDSLLRHGIGYWQFSLGYLRAESHRSCPANIICL